MTVRNGVVSEVKRGDTGEVIPAGEYDPIPTVPELFDELERAFWIADGWSATYDPDTGYPQSASFNWTSVIDDEITRYISKLTELP